VPGVLSPAAGVVCVVSYVFGLPRVTYAVSLQCIRLPRRYRLSTHATSSSRFQRIRCSCLLRDACHYGNRPAIHFCTAPKVG